MRANNTKSIQVTLTNRREKGPPVIFNGHQLPLRDETKYLVVHLDRPLTWRKYNFTKRKQPDLKLR